MGAATKLLQNPQKSADNHSVFNAGADGVDVMAQWWRGVSGFGLMQPLSRS
jgi:hypothetical protein